MAQSKMFELFYQYAIYACCVIILECRYSFPVLFLGEWINKWMFTLFHCGYNSTLWLPILPRFTRRTLAQLRTNKSAFFIVYLHKVDAKTHPSPLCPLCNTHTRQTSSLQLHLHTHHIVTHGFVDRPRRSECTAGQMDGEDVWWTTRMKIGQLVAGSRWF